MTSANLMTIEDAAEVLHVSVGALRARIRRGTVFCLSRNWKNSPVELVG